MCLSVSRNAHEPLNSATSNSLAGSGDFAHVSSHIFNFLRFVLPKL